MHLRRLKIDALPGIEPGFEFTPGGRRIDIVAESNAHPTDAAVRQDRSDIIIVIGPNASGKSSLIRALAHLLQPQRGDPPALSLEAEFDSNGTSWRVRRNGGQVVWTRNGELADQPPLPAVGRLGMYRLAMENLLQDDQSDQEIAQELLHTLHGGFDLGKPRIHLPTLFASAEARALRQAQQQRIGREQDYDHLRQQEAELPTLEAEIEAAETAQRRCERLEQAVNLHNAICNRRAAVDALGRFPPDMHRLAGNEVALLEQFEGQWQDQHNTLQQHQRDLATHQAELAHTGLGESRPKSEEIAANQNRLRRIQDRSVERNGVAAGLAQAEAAVRDAIAQFNDHELAPSLDAESTSRSERIAGPLIEAKARRRKLEQQLDLAGKPPDPLEIDQCRDGAKALRQWLATAAAAGGQRRARGAWRNILPLFVVLITAVFTGLAAYLQDAWLAAGGAVAAIAAALWALLNWPRRKGPSPAEEAQRNFTNTNLEPPSEWSHATVGERLLQIEGRLTALLLQGERAANADGIQNQIAEVDRNLAELDQQKKAFAREVGFDPELPAAAFHHFVLLSVTWDGARRECAQYKANVERLNQEIEEDANRVGEFISHWSGGETAEFLLSDGSFDMDLLICSFNALQERTAAAENAEVNAENARTVIREVKGNIESTEANIAGLFEFAELAPEEGANLEQWQAARQTLVDRIDRLGDWRSAKQHLSEAKTTENNIRQTLRNHPDLDIPAGATATDKLRTERQHLAQCLRWVYTDALLQLQQAQMEAADRSNDLQNLRDRRTTITATLNNAGLDRALENALNQETQAQAALEDKRDHAFLSEATNLLLDDVQQAFQAEHEPEVLQRARKLFREVTSHAFDFELNGDGSFTARDLTQNAPRTLGELSSGTRMQLLLALRLAWIRTQEQDASPLPLFLDEALTTSDEGRFKAMAQSLERLSAAEGRQIFYLSARRQEPALWRQSTGNESAVVDLAAIRFGKADADPQDYEVAMPPPVPSPNGCTPASYAAQLGVPPYNPRMDAGSIHPFHLLRNDLDLLHRLLDTWRIFSLGQLEALLKSSAAQGAITDSNLRQTLLSRCAAARHWVALWRQGRGKPVDRPALEQSGAVTPVFIDRATDLAAELEGNGQDLIAALSDRRLPHFLTHNIKRLEQWLTDEGYIDNQPPLSPDERHRQTLQRAIPQTNAQADDLNQLIDWLETALYQQAQ